MMPPVAVAAGSPRAQADDAASAALLGSGAVLVWNDVEVGARDAFYAWHDHEHIPERLGIPGFRRGRRFARAGHSPEWLTMYEADDLSVMTSPAYLARLNEPTPGTQSILPHFRNTSRAVCRVVHSAGSSTGGFLLAMRLEARERRVDVMRSVFPEALLAQVGRITGVVACHLYASDDPSSFIDTAESGTRTFDVPAYVLLCEATRASSAEQVKALLAEAATACAPAVRVRDAAVYALEICRLASSRHAMERTIAR